MNLSDHLKQIQDRIGLAHERGGHSQDVKLVAVTKTHPAETIIEALDSGLTHIGENRIQEAESKFPKVPETTYVIKHLIGHLQSNKVNKALSFFDRIDSIDTVSLAEKISRKLLSEDRTIPALLEVNTSGETTKNGFEPIAVEDMLSCMELPGLQVEGLMTIGPLTDDEKAIRDAFITLRNLKERLNTERSGSLKLTELSMGMSGDFEIAIEEGSTMVRLGTALFGPRRVL